MVGDANPERRAVAKANRALENLEGAVRRERVWEGEIVDRLRAERQPGVWHSG